jgi:tetratricopeptide (TPR) repeat protein
MIAITAAAATLLVLAGASGRADEFVLTSGAKIRGKWLNPQERSAGFYLIETEYGGNVRLDSKAVASVRRPTPAEIDYERIAPRVKDNVEDQWKLAKWCRQQGLKQQAAEHAQRVIELDPQHADARRSLGYGFIDGRWVLRQEYLESKGYVRYEGEWRLPEEIELLQSRRAVETAQKDWYAKLKLWRSRLGSDRSPEALRSIRAIRDPLAIEGLSKLLAGEPDRRVRLLYVEVLGQVQGDAASGALVDFSLAHPDDEVFHACVEQLASRATPPIVRRLAHTLKDNNNVRVNRAALALSQLGDKSVISPLIDALVTTHQRATVGSGATTTMFGSGPQMVAGNLQRASSEHFTQNVAAPLISQGQDNGKVTTYQANNQEVLKALTTMTGVSFGFDQRAWRNWYAVEQRRQKPGSFDTRRSS